MHWWVCATAQKEVRGQVTVVGSLLPLCFLEHELGPLAWGAYTRQALCQLHAFISENHFPTSMWRHRSHSAHPQENTKLHPWGSASKALGTRHVHIQVQDQKTDKYVLLKIPALSSHSVRSAFPDCQWGQTSVYGSPTSPLWNAYPALCSFVNQASCLFILIYRNFWWILNINPFFVEWVTGSFPALLLHATPRQLQ